MGNIQTSGPNQAVYISGQVRVAAVEENPGGLVRVCEIICWIVAESNNKTFLIPSFYKRADINYHWEYQTRHGGFPWVLFTNFISRLASLAEIMTESSVSLSLSLRSHLSFVFQAAAAAPHLRRQLWVAGLGPGGWSLMFRGNQRLLALFPLLSYYY